MHRYDERRLDQMISLVGPSVYRLAFSLTKNRSDADDVYQEVFIAYMRNKPNFENERHARSWFFKVTSNACKKLWRNPFYKRTEAFDETFHHIEPSTKGDYQVLYEAISTLTFKYREVIHLFYFEEYSTHEIAELLSVNESTIRTRLSRARDQLKNIMEKDQYV